MRQQTNFSSEWNQQYVTNFNYSFETDPNTVYFINSSSDTYTLTLLRNVCLYALLKFLHFLFFLLRDKCSLFLTIYMKIKRDTMWWTFIVTVIEVNMMNLAFDCGVQLAIPSFYQFVNKANFLTMALILFFLLIYSLCFYTLVANYASNKASAVLL